MLTVSMLEAEYTMDALMWLLIVLFVTSGVTLMNPLLATYFDIVSWTSIEMVAEAYHSWTEDLTPGITSVY
jgi:hypothetical protein